MTGCCLNDDQQDQYKQDQVITKMTITLEVSVFELSARWWLISGVTYLQCYIPWDFIGDKICSLDICVMRNNCENGLCWCRKWHSEELHYLYSSPHIIRAVWSERIRLLGQVACLRAMKNSCRCWFKNLTESDHLENLGVNDRILLNWFLKNENGCRLD
jgi:hypothetical protein